MPLRPVSVEGCQGGRTGEFPRSPAAGR